MYTATIRTADGRLLPLTIFARSIDEAWAVAKRFVSKSKETVVAVN